MEELLRGVIYYFALGLILLGGLEVFANHRITSKLYSASMEVQEKLTLTGNHVGFKVAMALTVLALLIFWPAAIYGALTPSERKTIRSRRETEDDSDG